MAVLVSQILNMARTCLNDDDSSLWTDVRLMPKLVVAHDEMMLRFTLAGVPVLNSVTAVITVPALTTDLTTVVGYPNDLTEPIWMKERAIGQTNEDFVDMTETDFLPNLNQSNELIYWCWQKEKIFLVGAKVDRQVQIRYMFSLAPPKLVTDTVGVSYAELFLSRRVAGLAYESIGLDNRADRMNTVAEGQLGTILRSAIKEMQNLPAKRRAYHRGRGRNRVLRDV